MTRLGKKRSARLGELTHIPPSASRLNRSGARLISARMEHPLRADDDAQTPTPFEDRENRRHAAHVRPGACNRSCPRRNARSRSRRRHAAGDFQSAAGSRAARRQPILLKHLNAPRGATASLLRVISGAAVGARERVVVVEVGETWLVLGVAPGQVTKLHELPRQSLAAAKETAVPEKNFAAWLKQVVDRRNAAK